MTSGRNSSAATTSRSRTSTSSFRRYGDSSANSSTTTSVTSASRMMYDSRAHMPQAIVYCRVSSDRQVKEGHGLEGQEMRCRRYAEALGYEVVAVFRDEGVSGGIIDREGMQEMLD